MNIGFKYGSGKQLFKITLIVFCFWNSMVYSQNMRFSSYEMAPMMVNPSLTGNIETLFRASASYRSQWAVALSPFTTGQVAFDGNIRPNILTTDEIGIGGYLAYDKSGDGNLSVIRFMPSTAFHKSFDEMGKYSLGVGVQAGFIQKSIDFENLIFPDQYNGTSFDKEIQTQQVYQVSSFWNFDAGVGVVWQYKEKGKSLSKIQYVPPLGEIIEAQVGFAVNQINRSYETFLFNHGNRLRSRTVIHGHMVYKHTSPISFIPSILLMKQYNVWEVQIGGDVEYGFINHIGEIALTSGVRYRHRDAFLLRFGMRYNDYTMQLGYDLNHSSLIRATKSVGAIELHVKREWPKRGKVNCPKFHKN